MGAAETDCKPRDANELPSKLASREGVDRSSVSRSGSGCSAVFDALRSDAASQSHEITTSSRGQFDGAFQPTLGFSLFFVAPRVELDGACCRHYRSSHCCITEANVKPSSDNPSAFLVLQ